MTQMTPQQFVAKWRNITVTERAGSQSHFNDLCDLLGHPKPARRGPDRRVVRLREGREQGVGRPGLGRRVEARLLRLGVQGAARQPRQGVHAAAATTRGNLGNPPLLIVCDITAIIIHTHFTNFVDKPVTLTLDDLLEPAQPRPAPQGVQRPGCAAARHETTEHVTEEAAAQFGELARQAPGERSRSPKHAVAHFLIRLLFCLFAEDVGILPRRPVYPADRGGRNKPRCFQGAAAPALRGDGDGRLLRGRDHQHVNGGLFNDDSVLLLDDASLQDALAEVSSLDWSAIEPASSARSSSAGSTRASARSMGAHFTVARTTSS